MTEVFDTDDGKKLFNVEYRSDVVDEALRRGIVEKVKIVKIRTSWPELDALKAEMDGAWLRQQAEVSLSDQAALEGGDVPDDEEVK